ncbi:MAG: DUF3047 domain-containing protein [Rubrivivax sp.]|nr:DUF3047 domain-containing protein [Rubrivivax sp.]
MVRHRARLCAALALALAACAWPPPEPPAPEPEPLALPAGWQAVVLPGKRPTHYAATRKAGRDAVAAHSERSASMLRKRVQRHSDQLGHITFSWWVEDLIDGASVADIDREDAPARVLLGFGGDHARLPARTRMMFELAAALTGETPPYATLMYVWDAQAPVGSVIVNPRTDRVRKIVVDSGPMNLRRWRDHRRDLAADFRLAFGEDPGPLLSIAVMTDSDNTRSRAQSWYGAVTLH